MDIWTHRDLAAWREAMNLAEFIYRETAHFPAMERYGLAAQMRRAAVSIPSNIAEGSGRNSTRELVQFLGIASGSIAELNTQLELAIRLGYIDDGTGIADQANRVGKLVNGLRRSMRGRINSHG